MHLEREKKKWDGKSCVQIDIMWEEGTFLEYHTLATRPFMVDCSRSMEMNGTIGIFFIICGRRPGTLLLSQGPTV